MRRAAVITHGKPQTIGPALERLEKVAREAGVELLLPDEEVEKHGVGEPEEDLSDADIAVVLGGDGTMLRALQRFLGTKIPVVGVNFGRVGFLASIQPNELVSGLARVFSGDYRVVREIAEAALTWGGETVAAVDSGLPGPKGNREVFLHLVHREHPELPDDLDDRIAAAVI